jgi:hypothetical protein
MGLCEPDKFKGPEGMMIMLRSHNSDMDCSAVLGTSWDSEWVSV